MLWARVMRGISSMRKERHAAIGQVFDRLRIAERIGRADDDQAVVEQIEIGATCVRIGAERADLEHDVGGIKQRAAIGDDFGARGAIGVVGEAGRNACSRFDVNFAAELLERGDRGRHQRHAPLTRKCLFGNGDDHGATCGAAAKSSFAIKLRFASALDCASVLCKSSARFRQIVPNRGSHRQWVDAGNLAGAEIIRAESHA